MSDLTVTKESRSISMRQITVIGVMTAVTCVLAPFSVPIGPVPISLANLALYLSLYVLGRRRATVSYLVYLLIGMVGLPVFSGFGSGPARLFGPTGGYLIGFLPMLLIAGTVIDRRADRKLPCLLGMVAGTAVCYTFGTVWLAWQAGLSAQAALAAGVLPFIPGDLLKIIAVLMIGPQIRQRLVQAQLY